MGSSKRDSNKAKYSKEVEEIKRLKDLNRILKAGDVENALLSNSSKDSETLNDNVLDKLLDKANTYETAGNDRGLEMIERLTTVSGGARVMKQKNVKVVRSKGKVKVKRKIHMVKRAASKKKRKR
ncbi:MAG: hypothetical protein ACHQX1_01800 [Candidatus Micrarchaeales archaeon]